VKINGRDVIQLCSNNSLGLSVNPRVVKAAKEYLETYGTGCGGSRLVSGNLAIQSQLERKFASFMGYEDAIVFMTGYMGNLGAIEALTNTFNLDRLPGKENIVGVFSDHENHQSIVHGCQLGAMKSHAVIRTYDHINMTHLEELLRSTHTSRKIIITEGVFSMRGDLAPLPEIVSLAKKYKALVYLDDAHAIGHLGKRGRGSIEHWGVKDVDIVLGTFSKAFGATGGGGGLPKLICVNSLDSKPTHIYLAQPFLQQPWVEFWNLLMSLKMNRKFAILSGRMPDIFAKRFHGLDLTQWVRKHILYRSLLDPMTKRSRSRIVFLRKVSLYQQFAGQP